MRTKLQKKWDLPAEWLFAFVVLSVAFFLGGGIGCLLAALSNAEGAEELCEYLTHYLSLAGENALSINLWPLLWHHMKYFLASLALSFTALGILGIPIAFGLRGFFFSFSSACFCRVFGVQGLFPAFVLFALPALLWVPALFMSGIPGFLSSQLLLRRAAGEGRGGSSFSGFSWSRLFVCTVLTIAAGLLEYFVLPSLMQVVAQAVL